MFSCCQKYSVQQFTTYLITFFQTAPALITFPFFSTQPDPLIYSHQNNQDKHWIENRTKNQKSYCKRNLHYITIWKTRRGIIVFLWKKFVSQKHFPKWILQKVKSSYFGNWTLEGELFEFIIKDTRCMLNPFLNKPTQGLNNYT